MEEFGSRARRSQDSVKSMEGKKGGRGIWKGGMEVVGGRQSKILDGDKDRA